MSESRGLAVRVNLILLGLLFLVTTIALAIRIDSLVHQGGLGETSGCEASSIYNVWKLRHGLTLYEPLERDPYSLTAFNAGFYYFYAAALNALRVADNHTPLAGRLVTLMLTVVGAIGQWRLIQALAPDRSIHAKLVALAVVGATWLGCLTSWWTMTMRPDIGAVAFTTWALVILIRKPKRPPIARLVAASAFFVAAWSFKQSVVWTMAGCCAYWLLLRNFRAIALVVAPLVLVAGASVLFGGEDYRQNIIGVQRAYHFDWRAGPIHALQAMGIAGWFWILPAVVVLLGLSRIAWPEVPDSDASARRVSASAEMLGCVAMIALLFAILGMSKGGADRNYVFESCVASATLAAAAVINLSRQAVARRSMIFIVSALGLMAMIAFAGAQLAGVRGTGRVRLLSTEEETAARERMNVAKQMPKPLLTRDRMLSLPWNCTDNQYPAIVIDDSYFTQPMVVARLERPLLRHRVETHAFASMLIEPSDPLYSLALENGYRAQASDGSPEVKLFAPR